MEAYLAAITNIGREGKTGTMFQCKDRELKALGPPIEWIWGIAILVGALFISHQQAL